MPSSDNNGFSNFFLFPSRSLNELLEQHKYFCKLNLEAFTTLNQMVSHHRSILSIDDFYKKIVCFEQLNNLKTQDPGQISHKEMNSDQCNSSLLLKENRDLKEKVQKLEDKCKYLEKKVDCKKKTNFLF